MVLEDLEGLVGQVDQPLHMVREILVILEDLVDLAGLVVLADLVDPVDLMDQVLLKGLETLVVSFNCDKIFRIAFFKLRWFHAEFI